MLGVDCLGGSRWSIRALLWVRCSLTLALLGVLWAACASARPDGPSGLEIGGVVQDRCGVPIPGTWYRVMDARVPLSDCPWRRADAGGKFHLGRINAESVRIQFVPGDRKLVDEVGKVIDVSMCSHDLVVVLEAGRELQLRIKNYVPSNVRPNLANLVWRRASGPVLVRTQYVRPDGWVRFVQLPRDTEFEAWGWVSDDDEFRTPGLLPAHQEQLVEASKTRDISGVVIPPEGESVLCVSLRLEPYPGFARRYVTPEEDGSFRLRGVPIGSYDLIGQLSCGRIGRPAKVVVQAGDADVTLRVQ